MSRFVFDTFFYTINESYQLQSFSHNLIDSGLTPSVGALCHEVFCGRKEPCPECPVERREKLGSTLFRNPLTKEWTSAHFSNITLPDGNDGYAIVCKQLSTQKGAHIKSLKSSDIAEFSRRENAYRENYDRLSSTASNVLRENTELSRIIDTLAADFDLVLYANLSTDSCIAYRAAQYYRKYLPLMGREGSFSRIISTFAEKLVHQEDRDSFNAQMSPGNLVNRLLENPVYMVEYRLGNSTDYVYFQTKVVCGEDDPLTGFIILGFHSIDAVRRSELEHHNMIEQMLQNETSYRRALFSDAAGHYEANLTSDLILGDICVSVDGVDTPITDMIDLPKPLKYSELQDFWENSQLLSNLEDHKRVCNADRLIQSYLHGEFAPEVTYFTRTPSGQESWHRQTHYLTRDEHSGDILAKVVIKDVTEAVKKELELQQNHELIESLSYDYTSVFYIDLNENNIISYSLDTLAEGRFGRLIANEDNCFSRVFDSYVDNYVDKENRELVRPLFTIAYIKNMLSNKQSFSVLYLALFGYSKQYVEAKVVRIGSGSDVNHIVIGFANKDEETRREQERQRELLAALESATAASRAKTEFLFNMSHDIRTPMNAIIGFTMLAQANIHSSDKVLDYLQKINTASSHLLSIINDVLDMSRIESGKINLTETSCCVPDILNEINTIIHDQISGKRLEFSVVTSNVQNNNIICDKTRLLQVLLNLLSNAIKFTPEKGKVSLRLTQLENTSSDFATFEFKVKDNGIGMSKEFLTRVFDPFERERTSTVSGTQGTGLGMTITKRIVDLMHGTISVESKKGKGTEFTVLLTFKTCDFVHHNAASLMSSSPAESEFAGKRILLAEDNDLNREIAIELLNGFGFIVESAINGSQALNMLMSAPPDHYCLVLMDIQMPIMDGYEATEKIRSLPDPVLSGIPIIAMTANAFEEDRQHALDHGMNGFIPKPIDLNQMIRTIKLLL